MQEQENKEILPELEAKQEQVQEVFVEYINSEAEKPDSLKEVSPFLYTERTENHWTQFWLLLCMVGVGLVAASFFSLLVVKLMMPQVKLFNLEKELFNPANVTAMKVMQLGSTILMFFLPAVLFALIIRKKPFSFIGFNCKVSFQQIGLVLVIACMAILAGGVLSDLNERIPISKHLQESFKKAEEAYNQQVLAIAKMNNLKDYLIALIIIALTPAIVEETFFRGTLQQFFIRWFGNPWIAILFTSIIFSAIHFSYYGFLTRASLGIVLGLLFYYSKNLWLNILAHFLNNAIAVTLLYVYSMQGKPPKDALDDHFPIVLGLVSAAILVYLIFQFKKASEVVLKENEV